MSSADLINMIIYSRAGPDLVVKITDFGLAKDRKLSMSSQINSLVGSPAFIAPEILDRKAYNESVDIFSLGIVFLAVIQFKKGDEKPIMPHLGLFNILCYTCRVRNTKTSIIYV